MLAEKSESSDHKVLYINVSALPEETQAKSGNETGSNQAHKKLKEKSTQPDGQQIRGDIKAQTTDLNL
jgi:hypothetical protein